MIYSTKKILIPGSLDELGLNLSLPRLESESLGDYRKRLLLEVRDPSGPTQDQFCRNLSRRVGLVDVPVFEIGLKLSGGVPLAVDPLVEVTSNFLRLYHDVDDEPEFEINLTEVKFLNDVYALISGSTYFDVEILDTDYDYKRSLSLRYCKSTKFMDTEFLNNSRQNRLTKSLIADIYPNDMEAFQNEIFDLNFVDDGDYYVDYLNGVIFSKVPMKGYLSYSYREFPFTMFWNQVRSFPFNDNDKNHRIMDLVNNDVSEPKILNSYGASIVNEILEVSSLEWGK